ncbi:hypothetical protein CABS01_07684 [Colletotrichum abscissum]|uniref:uncharacterized protein n=1 Tax=Colletotrichum abscissum TaxID=1671311 RepID=UPI0027D74566|nr:uncharacterized protein CABS01_07684 [Colletotrichum abscissum]KAK1510012.1 hypothetical protein CABS01_07684 [Colletotrichum abscissum]
MTESLAGNRGTLRSDIPSRLSNRVEKTCRRVLAPVDDSRIPTADDRRLHDGAHDVSFVCTAKRREMVARLGKASSEVSQAPQGCGTKQSKQTGMSCDGFLDAEVQPPLTQCARKEKPRQNAEPPPEGSLESLTTNLRVPTQRRMRDCFKGSMSADLLRSVYYQARSCVTETDDRLSTADNDWRAS